MVGIAIMVVITFMDDKAAHGLFLVISDDWWGFLSDVVFAVVVYRYVSLACLPDGVAVPADGKKCWITGWGHLSSSGAAPDILQEVSVPVISTARCENSYPEKIGDSMICAGLDEGGIDACQGDSGGPMVCEEGGRYYLQGVTSWGYGCASPGKFGVYAKVKFVMKWLKDEMAKN